ncbi:hypothetical protein QFW85_12545 [Vibrio chagasii]|uniref:hypothetical protein n=1 Tax=Vibrio chagasii TaxID=170679 RepID=UPI003DA828BE
MTKGTKNNVITTVLTKHNAFKNFSVEDGNLKKDTVANIDVAQAERITLDSVRDLLPYLDNGECLFIHGMADVVGCKQKPYTITPNYREDHKQKRVGRTKRRANGRGNFTYNNEYTTALIDIDDPHEYGYVFTDVETLIQDLTNVLPALRDVELLAYPSSSNGIKINTKFVNKNKCGNWHIYLIGSKKALQHLEQYIERILWSSGYGKVKISKSGARLMRCLVDLSVLSPERIDFANKPNLSYDVQRDKPAHYHRDGGFLEYDDLKSVINDKLLKNCVQKLKATAYNDALPAAEDAFKNWLVNSTIGDNKAQMLEWFKQGYTVIDDEMMIHVRGQNGDIQVPAGQIKTGALNGYPCKNPLSEIKSNYNAIVVNGRIWTHNYKMTVYVGEPPELFVQEHEIQDHNISTLEQIALNNNDVMQNVCTLTQTIQCSSDKYEFTDRYNGIIIGDLLRASAYTALPSTTESKRAFAMERGSTLYNINDSVLYSPVTCLRDPAGGGKSFSASYLAMEMLIAREKVCFISNSKANCAQFAHDNPTFTQILGNADVAEKTLPSSAISRALELLQEQNKHGELKRTTSRVAEMLLKEQLITQLEHDEFKQALNLNNGIIVEADKAIGVSEVRQLPSAITLTAKKLQKSNILSYMHGYYFIIDESNATEIHQSIGLSEYSVYKTSIRISGDLHVNSCTSTILDGLVGSSEVVNIKGVLYYQHKDPRFSGVCYMSAEGSFIPALSKILERDYKGVQMNVIDDPKRKIIDNNLHLTYVKTTSNRASVREELVKRIREHNPNITIIGDGKDLYGEPIADVSIEACKGNDALKSMDLAAYVSYPSAEEVAHFMWSCSMTEDEAVATIVTDKFNQLMRNVGYRHEGYKLEVLVPVALRDKITHDVFTVNVFDLSNKDKQASTASSNASMTDVVQTTEVKVRTAMHTFIAKSIKDFIKSDISVKETKKAIKQALADEGLSQADIKKYNKQAVALFEKHFTKERYQGNGKNINIYVLIISE